MRNRLQPWRLAAWLAVSAAAIATVPVLAADSRARVLAGNTLVLACSTATLSLLCGAPLAFLLTRTDVFGRRLAGVTLLALLFTPLYLQAAGWQAGFGSQGWYTIAFGGPALVDGWRGAILIHTLAAVPWVVLIVAVGLRLSEPELEEEALLDGTPGQVFRRVTLSRTREALVAAWLWVAVTTAGEMTVTDLFLIRTYAEEIYIEFALGDTLGGATWRLLPSIAAAAWVIAAGLVIASAAIAPDRHPSDRLAGTFRLRRWRGAASAFVLGSVGLLLLVPAANLALKAGRTVTRSGDAFVRGWSAAQCLDMVAGSPLRFAREFGWTLCVGAVAATAAVLIGLPLAWSARRGGWHAVPAWVAVALCLALPGPLIGLGLIALFNAAPWSWLAWLYDRSIVPICAAQTIRALPCATLVLWFALRTFPTDLLASATLEGATPLVRFVRIVLPARKTALAAAWIAALAMASGELDASILVVPPGVNTLPIHIFGLIHYGVDDQVAGVALLVMLVFLALAAAISLAAQRAERISARDHRSALR
ncbi:MAG: ABC transporter permease [Pirellulales bacterium]